MITAISNVLPDPDKVLVDIAEYATKFEIDSAEAYDTARLCLMDTLGCGLEALTYPAAARRRGMSGTVHLDISVEPTGRIADVLVVRSSSHELLDAAAVDAVRRLRHVPFPAGVRPRPVRVRLPVVFELR